MRTTLLRHVLVLLAALAASAAAVASISPTGGDLYEDALQRFGRGDYEGAVIQLRNVLRDHPHDAPARLLLGRSYVRIGDGAAAEIELRRARRGGSDERLVLAPLARAYLLQGKFQPLFDEIPVTGVPPDVVGEIRLVRGDARLDQNELDKADDEYAKAAKLLPDSAAPLIGRGRVMLARGRYDEAMTLADAAEKIDAGSAGVWYLRGEVHRLNDELEPAVADYDKALEHDPHDLLARIGRAAALIDLDRAADAKADLDKVLRADPTNLQAGYLFALVLARGGDMTSAQRVLDRLGLAIAAMDPTALMNNPPMLLLSGVISYARDKPEDALSYLERYVDLAPYGRDGRFLLGSLDLRLGRPAAAAVVLEPAVRRAPDDVALITTLATAYMRTGQVAKASKLFEHAVELAPSKARLRASLALARLASGDRGAAVSELEQARTIAPQSRELLVILGMTQLRSGEFDKALASARALIKEEPKNPFPYSLAGAAHTALGDLAAARKSFEHALVVAPAYTSARFDLAKLDLKEGKVADAERRLEAIVKADRNDTAAMMELAAIARSRGETAKAIEWLEKIHQIEPRNVKAGYRLVELRLAEGKPESARSVARELDSAVPDSPYAIEALGRAQLAEGERENAAATFKRLTAVARTSGWKARAALLQLQAGDADGAAETLDRAIRSHPADVTLRTAMVRVETSRGRYEHALEQVQKIAVLMPHSGESDLLRGDVYMREKQGANAIDAYRAGLEKQPSSTLALRLYHARRAAGKLDAALHGLETWSHAHPDDVAAQRALAAGYIDAGRLDEALAMHEKLLAKFPGDASLLNNLAGIYQRKGDARALEFARRANAEAPDAPATLDTLGWVLVTEGHASKGLPFLRRAQNQRSADPRIAYHVAVALEKLGRREDARRQLEAALLRSKDFEGAADARALLRKLGG